MSNSAPRGDFPGRRGLVQAWRGKEWMRPIGKPSGQFGDLLSGPLIGRSFIYQSSVQRALLAERIA